MDAQVVLFFEKCRLCLDNPGACNVFDTEDLARDIYSCTGVKVSPSDNLPQKICTKCTDIVLRAKELRLLATTNNSYLRSLFDEDGEEITEQVSTSADDNSCNYLELLFKACDRDKEIRNENKKTKSSTQTSLDTKQSFETKKPKEITIRKDLFQSSEVVSSSTKVGNKELYDAHGQRKRIKWETGTVVYDCEVCSKQFKTWKKLYLHMRLHNKTLACPLDACGKKFATKGDLEKHLRTHTGVKPYQCHICDKCFAQQVTLKAHKENVHNCFDIVKRDAQKAH